MTQSVKKSGLKHNNSLSSHITTLPGTHNARENTDKQIEQVKQDKLKSYKSTTSFRVTQSQYLSVHQHRSQPEEETKEVPAEFRSFRRSDDTYQNKKSETARKGHSKNFHSSGFQLE